MTRLGIYLGANTDDVSNIDNVLKTWVYALSDAGYKIELVGGVNIAEQLRGEATIRPVTDTRSQTPFGKIKDTYTHLSRYISNRQPTAVIQLWKYQTHAPGVALAGELHDTATIVRFTGDIFREYQGYNFPYSAGVFLLANILGRIPLRIASKVVTLGPNLKNAVLSRGVSESDVHLIPPPRPDEDLFFPVDETDEVKADLEINVDRPVALFVGRLTKQKGMPFLKEVIDATLSKTNFQFVLIGEGPYKDVFRNRFSAERVILPGYVPCHRIAKYYQAASVYVHPSQFEGIPLVILEALQSGLPVLARDSGDIGFVLEDVVQTEQQMIDHLVRRDWNERWRNEKYFSSEFQQREIIHLVRNLNK